MNIIPPQVASTFPSAPSQVTDQQPPAPTTSQSFVREANRESVLRRKLHKSSQRYWDAILGPSPSADQGKAVSNTNPQSGPPASVSILSPQSVYYQHPGYPLLTPQHQAIVNNPLTNQHTTSQHGGQ